MPPSTVINVAADSDGISVNGIRYLPARDIARAHGYVADYVVRLCRQGKVRTHRLGRYCYVDADSFIAHIRGVRVMWTGAWPDSYPPDRSRPRYSRFGSCPGDDGMVCGGSGKSKYCRMFKEMNFVSAHRSSPRSWSPRYVEARRTGLEWCPSCGGTFHKLRMNGVTRGDAPDPPPARWQALAGRLTYSITSSARSRNASGIARPIASAAIRLTTRSKLPH
jgi:hypothetical protein